MYSDKKVEFSYLYLHLKNIIIMRFLQLRYIFLFFVLIVVDIVTKYIVFTYKKTEIVLIYNILNIIHIKNKGIFLEFFNNYNSILILIIMLAMMFILIIAIIIFDRHLIINLVKDNILIITIILSGIVSNIYNKISKGYIIDFIDIHYNTLHWPTFNFADSYILIGTVILIYRYIYRYIYMLCKIFIKK